MHHLPADYTLVLVDGLRVPGGVVDLRRFPIENFERVENVTETASLRVAAQWQFGEISSLNLWASAGLFWDQFLLDQKAPTLDLLNDTRERSGHLGAQFNQQWSSHRASVGLRLDVDSPVWSPSNALHC